MAWDTRGLRRICWPKSLLNIMPLVLFLGSFPSCFDTGAAAEISPGTAPPPCFISMAFLEGRSPAASAKGPAAACFFPSSFLNLGMSMCLCVCVCLFVMTNVQTFNQAVFPLDRLKLLLFLSFFLFVCFCVRFSSVVCRLGVANQSRPHT